jgi:Tfp pilus assembly protein PilN
MVGAAALTQLGFYRASRIRFGDTLMRLPQHVPESIQFTELRVPPPPPLPAPDPALKVQPPGPTNLVEAVTLRIAGRVGSSASSEAVRSLLDALRQPAYTNLIRKAEIPKGAFRQDSVRGPAARESILFEITCACGERRFK